MRRLHLLGFIGAALVACGGGGPGARQGNGYQEYECPQPVGKIVREDCARSALQYDGATFGGSVTAGGIGASASYKETAIREADALVAMLKEQRVGVCNDFNTCKLSVDEYRVEKKQIDDSFVALLALKDKMAQLDAEGASKLLGELQKIRLANRGDAVRSGAKLDTIPNGDFETCALDPWIATAEKGGYAQIVRAGSSFSSYATEFIPFADGSCAVNIRSAGVASTDSIGVLTSPELTVAADAIQFVALSETNGPETPTRVELRVLAPDYSILATREIKSALVNTERKQSSGWSTHCVNVRALAGRRVRLQFRQHTNVAPYGFFTLIDQVRFAERCP